MEEIIKALLQMRKESAEFRELQHLTSFWFMIASHFKEGENVEQDGNIQSGHVDASPRKCNSILMFLSDSSKGT